MVQPGTVWQGTQGASRDARRPSARAAARSGRAPRGPGLFGTSGYHQVSMDAVAREAGVTKPILYDHFPSKHDLYLALLDADLTLVARATSARALDAPTGNRERIRASFRAYFDFVDEHAAGFRLMMQETVGAEDDFRQHVERSGR